MARYADGPRYPSGRRKDTLGIQTGGAAWTQLHAQIAATALGILADTGYSAFTIDAVAKAAGTTRRTVYQHYPTKLALAMAAIRHLPTYEAWSVTGSTRERIHDLVASASMFPLRMPALMATALVHRQDAPELLAALSEHVLAPRRAIIATQVAQAQQAGEIRSDVTGEDIDTYVTGFMLKEAAGLLAFRTKAQRIRALEDGIWRLLDPDPPAGRPKVPTATRRKAKAVT